MNGRENFRPFTAPAPAGYIRWSDQAGGVNHDRIQGMRIQKIGQGVYIAGNWRLDRHRPSEWVKFGRQTHDI